MNRHWMFSLREKKIDRQRYIYIYIYIQRERERDKDKDRDRQTDVHIAKTESCRVTDSQKYGITQREFLGLMDLSSMKYIKPRKP